VLRFIPDKAISHLRDDKKITITKYCNCVLQHEIIRKQLPLNTVSEPDEEKSTTVLNKRSYATLLMLAV